MARNFSRGIQRNKVVLTLDNSELDFLADTFKDVKSDMAKHILEQVEKLRGY